jgi:hypothetical protein
MTGLTVILLSAFPIQELLSAIDAALGLAYSHLWREGRIQSAERAVPTHTNSI